MTSFLKKSASKVGRQNVDEPSTAEEEQTKVSILLLWMLISELVRLTVFSLDSFSDLFTFSRELEWIFASHVNRWCS